MRIALVISFLLSYTMGTWAQTPKTVRVEDPKAKAVFEKVRDRYEAYKTLQVNFSVEIEIPQQEAIQQTGSLYQDGVKYKLDLSDQMLMSDGNDLWLYRKEAKEVQINDLEEGDDSLLSPIDLLKIYERDDFEYALVNEFKDQKNRTIQQIELKPNAKNADYSKIRIEIAKSSAEILGMMAFFKDGVRYKVTVDETIPNKSFPSGTFTFDASQYPGVHVEDLRLD
jgi:outer membrane lipoprotein carrier protein